MAEGKVLNTTRRYSKEIGALLAEVQGTAPTYTLKGDEMYVRAKVIFQSKGESDGGRGHGNRLASTSDSRSEMVGRRKFRLERSSRAGLLRALVNPRSD